MIKKNTDEKPKRPVGGISVITSSVCNLQCSFCYLHKNSAYKQFEVIVDKAWNDGSYIENVYKSLTALNVDILGIKQLELWGGETLLSIERVTKNIANIFKRFPRLEIWRISTNFLVNMDNFINFLQEIDKLAPQEQLLKLQLSIDGPPGIITDTGHHGDWKIYYKNIDYFTSKMNQIKLNNLKIQISINSTVNSKVYLKEFSTYDGIKNYMQYMHDFCIYFDQRCINGNITFMHDYIFPGFALPYEESTDEGVLLSNIIKKWELVRAQEFPELKTHRRMNFDTGIGQLDKNRMLNTGNPECSELRYSLTFIPDGSICECSGCFIDAYEPYQEELKEQGEMQKLYRAKATAMLNYNPAKCSEKELEKYEWYITEGYKGNLSTYMTYMMGACKELAEEGQISCKYLDNPELLFKHLSAMSNLNACTRQNLLDTGVPYLTHLSCFRRYLNGAMDYIYDEEFNRLKQERGYQNDVFGTR